MDVGTETRYTVEIFLKVQACDLIFLASRHYTHDCRRHPLRMEGCVGKIDRRVLLPDPHHLGASRIHVWDLVSYLSLQIWVALAYPQTPGLAGGKRIVCSHCHWDILLGYLVNTAR